MVARSAVSPLLMNELSPCMPISSRSHEGGWRKRITISKDISCSSSQLRQATLYECCIVVMFQTIIFTGSIDAFKAEIEALIGAKLAT